MSFKTKENRIIPIPTLPVMVTSQPINFPIKSSSTVSIALKNVTVANVLNIFFFLDTTERRGFYLPYFVLS